MVPQSKIINILSSPIIFSKHKHLMFNWTNKYHTYVRVEQSVYALLRTRDMAISRYREYGIPVDWLSDSGVVGKVNIHL